MTYVYYTKDLIYHSEYPFTVDKHLVPLLNHVDSQTFYIPL